MVDLYYKNTVMFIVVKITLSFLKSRLKENYAILNILQNCKSVNLNVTDILSWSVNLKKPRNYLYYFFEIANKPKCGIMKSIDGKQ